MKLNTIACELVSLVGCQTWCTESTSMARLTSIDSITMNYLIKWSQETYSTFSLTSSGLTSIACIRHRSALIIIRSSDIMEVSCTCLGQWSTPLIVHPKRFVTSTWTSSIPNTDSIPIPSSSSMLLSRLSALKRRSMTSSTSLQCSVTSRSKTMNPSSVRSCTTTSRQQDPCCWRIRHKAYHDSRYHGWVQDIWVLLPMVPHRSWSEGQIFFIKILYFFILNHAVI